MYLQVKLIVSYMVIRFWLPYTIPLLIDYCRIIRLLMLQIGGGVARISFGELPRYARVTSIDITGFTHLIVPIVHILVRKNHMSFRKVIRLCDENIINDGWNAYAIAAKRYRYAVISILRKNINGVYIAESYKVVTTEDL